MTESYTLRERSSLGLMRVLLTLVGIVLVVGAIFLGFLHEYHKPRLVAEIPGPEGTQERYELWYSRNGDLSLHARHSRVELTAVVDYYGDLEVTETTWMTPDRVRIVLRNGTAFEAACRFDVDYSNWKPTPDTGVSQEKPRPPAAPGSPGAPPSASP